MDTPLISVVLPSFNHEPYIKQCLDSLILQTYSNIELIVIDDQSLDKTWDIILSYQTKLELCFAHTSFLKKEHNTGLVNSLTKGLSTANGDFFFVIASDDFLEPQALEKLASYLVLNKSVDLIVGDMNLVNEQGQRVGWDSELNPVSLAKSKYLTYCDYQKQQIPFDYLGDEFGSYQSLLQTNYIPVGFLFRTEKFRQLGGYQSGVRLDDYYTTLQFAKHSKLKYLDEPLFNYRVHSGNSTKDHVHIQGMTKELYMHELRNLSSEQKHLSELIKERIKAVTPPNPLASEPEAPETTTIEYLREVKKTTHKYLHKAKQLFQHFFSDDYLSNELTRYKTIKQALTLSHQYQAQVDPGAIIHGANETNFSLSPGVHIAELTYISLYDAPNSKEASLITIGANTYIGQFNNIRAAGQAIIIGKNCLISQGVSIIGSNHQTAKHSLIKEQESDIENGGIVIQDDVWIGANAVILPGVLLGKGSIIAAGAIVTKNTNPYTVNAGVPAKIISERR